MSLTTLHAPRYYERLVARLEQAQSCFYAAQATAGAGRYADFQSRLERYLTAERDGSGLCRGWLRVEVERIRHLAVEVSRSIERGEDPLPGLEMLYTLLDAYETAKELFREQQRRQHPPDEAVAELQRGAA